MARRPLPRVPVPSAGSAPFHRGRELLRAAAENTADVLHPLIVIGRGLRRLTAAGRHRWARTPRDRRGPALLLAAAGVTAVALAPHGPLLAVAAMMAAAAWAGRGDRAGEDGPAEAEAERLRALYEALVPYFRAEDDPDPLYAHGGDWEAVFLDHAFDDTGRPVLLELRYPPYFTDGEPGFRARIEQVLLAKCGRGREYLFDWDEEGNVLTATVLPPLPDDIRAQPFVTAPGETVLGFTGPESVRRTLPAVRGDALEDAADVPPVLWRTGPRSAEPHLIVLGRPGSGTTTLLRSIALQALRDGDVLVVDGSGGGEYACLAGRRGVPAVECGLSGALAVLEWAAHETERRLLRVHEARRTGDPVPEDVRRRLWILVDRPAALSQLAASEGRPDPQELLHVPLRHGRAAQVTVVVADHLDGVDSLDGTVRTHTRARVVLGPAAPEEIAAALGAPPETTPPPDVPPGRGYARLGHGPVHRLQVPATPDPYDEDCAEADRLAVLALLPEPSSVTGA
ncbi:ATP-binding protein, partial [Streptomyces albus]|uniref:ATP-binding protein n=1 Tax=Streptomyces albus TaxID=1888 RepID=UPI0004C65DFE